MYVPRETLACTTSQHSLWDNVTLLINCKWLLTSSLQLSVNLQILFFSYSACCLLSSIMLDLRWHMWMFCLGVLKYIGVWLLLRFEYALSGGILAWSIIQCLKTIFVLFTGSVLHSTTNNSHWVWWMVAQTTHHVVKYTSVCDHLVEKSVSALHSLTFTMLPWIVRHIYWLLAAVYTLIVKYLKKESLLFLVYLVI